MRKRFVGWITSREWGIIVIAIVLVGIAALMIFDPAEAVKHEPEKTAELLRLTMYGGALIFLGAAYLLFTHSNKSPGHYGDHRG